MICALCMTSSRTRPGNMRPMTRLYSKHDLTSLDVDTDVLRWFKKVAEGATATEVSDLEGVTQSGVSRALARLEEQVGTPLLRRAGLRLRLTQAGEVFKPYVDALLHQLDDGMTAVSQFVSPETGTVRLAFQQSLGIWLVPDLVRTFRALHPAVGFHLRQVTNQGPVGSLAAGDADLEISARAFPLVTRSRSGRGRLSSTRSAWPSPVTTGSPGSPASASRTWPPSRSSACGPARRCGGSPRSSVRGGLPPADRHRGRRPVQRLGVRGRGPGRRGRPHAPRELTRGRRRPRPLPGDR